MLSKLLNIPEGADPIETLSALSKLKLEAETLQAACAAKEAELAELRAQTAELFGSSLEEAGHDEEAVRAAMAAWLRDPETAAQAIAGCSIEEAVEAANPYGCNQHGHRKGHGDGEEEPNLTFPTFNADVNKAQIKYSKAETARLVKMIELDNLQKSNSSSGKIEIAKRALKAAEANMEKAGAELKRAKKEAEAQKAAREAAPEVPTKTVKTNPNKELKRQMAQAKDLYSDDKFGIAGDEAYADYEASIKAKDNNWHTGTFSAGGKKYEVQMKIYPRKYKDEASQFGIEGGDISKFWVRDENGDVVVNYDRGWDVKPKKPETKKMLRTLLEKYNGTKH